MVAASVMRKIKGEEPAIAKRLGTKHLDSILLLPVVAEPSLLNNFVFGLFEHLIPSHFYGPHLHRDITSPKPVGLSTFVTFLKNFRSAVCCFYNCNFYTSFDALLNAVECNVDLPEHRVGELQVPLSYHEPKLLLLVVWNLFRLFFQQLRMVRPGTADIEMYSTPFKVIALFGNTLDKFLALTSASLKDHMQFAPAEGMFSDAPSRSPTTPSPAPVLNTPPPLAQQPAKQRVAKRPSVASLPGVPAAITPLVKPIPQGPIVSGPLCLKTLYHVMSSSPKNYCENDRCKGAMHIASKTYFKTKAELVSYLDLHASHWPEEKRKKVLDGFAG
jgi:hypothetical protein